MKTKVLSIFLLILAIFYFYSCDKSSDPSSSDKGNDPAGSKVKSDQAYQMLEGDFDKIVNNSHTTTSDLDQAKFQEANSLYEDAVSLDPANTDAQFGAAITEILAAYSDPDLNKLIKDFEAAANEKDGPLSDILDKRIIPISPKNMNIPISAVAANIFKIHQLALNDPPLISRIQDVLKNKFLPRINTVIDRLSTLEANKDFKFVVSGKMQGDASLKPVTIYVTEIILTNAIMHSLKASLDIFLMYKFVMPDYSQASILNALKQDGTDFFVLNSDGKEKAAEAKNLFMTSIDKINLGITSLETISGNKPDAVIKLGEKNGVKQADLDTVKTYLNKIKTAFNQDVSVKVTGVGVNSKDYTIKINIGNFLNNPVQNPKAAYLPAYVVESTGNDQYDIRFRFTANTYNEFQFPDPTFSGLLPGMNNEILKELLEIDREFAFSVYGSAQFVGGNYDNWNDRYIKDARITMYLADGKTYELQTDSYGYFSFYILDASTAAVPVSKLVINTIQGDIELENISSYPLEIKSKESQWIQIQIPNKPNNLNVSKLSNGIYLQWSVNNSDYGDGQYVIQRKEGNGDFVDITDSYFYNYNYTDYNVLRGDTYSYRIKTSKNVDSWGICYFPVESYYSNIANINY